FGGFDGDEFFVEEEVVEDFQGAGNVEGDADPAGASEEEAGEQRADRGSGSTGDSGDAAGGGSLFGRDDGHGVGLASGDVHLADAETNKQDKDGQRNIRHERNQDQQNVRRQVREDHRANQADAGGDSGGEQRGDSGEDVRPEKDHAKRARLQAEAEVKPVGGEALHDEAAGEGVQGKETGEFQDDVARVCEAEKFAEQRGVGVRHRTNLGGG